MWHPKSDLKTKYSTQICLVILLSLVHSFLCNIFHYATLIAIHNAWSVYYVTMHLVLIHYTHAIYIYYKANSYIVTIFSITSLKELMFLHYSYNIRHKHMYICIHLIQCNSYTPFFIGCKMWYGLFHSRLIICTTDGIHQVQCSFKMT